MSKKKEYAVSYQEQHGGGNVYRQTVNLTQNAFNKLQNALLDQRAENSVEADRNGYDNLDYYFALYLATPLVKTGSMVFFNHTQRDFFNKYIGKYLKKPLLDRNTCFCIIA